MNATHAPAYARLSRRMCSPLPPKLAQPEPAHEQQARDRAAATRRGSVRMDRDFSHVRLHADAEAGRIADDFGARAMTVGDEIFFAPGEFAPHSNSGNSLLAHELTHVAQQAEAGQPALQFQPKKDKGGIGAAPPSEPFILMENDTGSEDDFVLFEQNDATLDSKDQKKILDVIGKREDPLQIFIHGYASAEGVAEYNINLSAHRAAAIKTFLEGKLPAGSTVTLFAHGKTEAFGKTANNRRAGVSLVEPLILPGSVGWQRKGGIGLDVSGGGGSTVTCDPNATFKFKLPVIGPRCGIDPDGLPKPSGLPPLPPVGGSLKIDWRGINEPGTAHGVRMSEREVQAFQRSGETLYRNLVPIFGAGVAEWWTNRVLMKAWESRVTLENPTLLDLSDLEFKQHYPDATGVPPLPLVTPESLNFIIKKTFKKDIDFHFDFP